MYCKSHEWELERQLDATDTDDLEERAAIYNRFEPTTNICARCQKARKKFLSRYEDLTDETDSESEEEKECQRRRISVKSKQSAKKKMTVSEETMAYAVLAAQSIGLTGLDDKRIFTDRDIWHGIETFATHPGEEHAKAVSIASGVGTSEDKRAAYHMFQRVFQKALAVIHMIRRRTVKGIQWNTYVLMRTTDRKLGSEDFDAHVRKYGLLGKTTMLEELFDKAITEYRDEMGARDKRIADLTANLVSKNGVADELKRVASELTETRRLHMVLQDGLESELNKAKAGIEEAKNDGARVNQELKKEIAAMAAKFSEKEEASKLEIHNLQCDLKIYVELQKAGQSREIILKKDLAEREAEIERLKKSLEEMTASHAELVEWKASVKRAFSDGLTLLGNPWKE